MPVIRPTTSAISFSSTSGMVSMPPLRHSRSRCARSAEQLLLTVAQRRRLLEVLRVDRSFLVATYLADLVVVLA